MGACGVEGSYEIRDVTEADLPEFVRSLREGAYRGCNVTMPYKAVLAGRCDRLEGDARVLGVVNTITVEERSLIGANTDALGFQQAMELEGLAPQPGFAALVLGAGGAATAVCLALARWEASLVSLVTRRPEAVRSIAERLAGVVEVTGVAWEPDALVPLLDGLGLVVNATPAGLSQLPLHPRALPASCTVADVRYRPAPVDVVSAARAAGLKASDGREMLVQQGLLSFRRWTGLEAPAPVARRALAEALG